MLALYSQCMMYFLPQRGLPIPSPFNTPFNTFVSSTMDTKICLQLATELLSGCSTNEPTLSILNPQAPNVNIAHATLLR
jgi:hypothetical protein